MISYDGLMCRLNAKGLTKTGIEKSDYAPFWVSSLTSIL